ncbi:uncharacterized protein LOC132201649 [Neocloeon triangulifer]|uniref:uncharacterized protein LOC132201649 n=1 Tax=Neocloeon triangulifer TaxID=2078957 RepID=UPI00286F6B5B|nr:uncharacterized protein LOC132201649 [Neocloeon triangulifer]
MVKGCRKILLALGTLALLQASCGFSLENREYVPHPDIGATPPEMIVRRGYPAETHFVTTVDGYILQMHRIPQPGKPVVFLQHGSLSSSADWLLMGPESSLAYFLFDNGYDIWMGNARGNTYSKNHTYLSVESNSKFWDFTFHEMGIYDLPAEIDYVLENTGQAQLNYVGHSMGTTQFFVLGSERPEYNAKIRQMHALAPVAFMGRVRSPLLWALVPWVWQFEWWSGVLGNGEYMPSPEFSESVANDMCADGSYLQEICMMQLFMLCGFDAEQFNETALPLMQAHSPAGTSTKTIIHFAKHVASWEFQQYDYGWVENMIVYGQMLPPNYHLNKVIAPVYLHYADNDWLAHPLDVQRIENNIGNLKAMVRMAPPSFNHIDFIWGIDATTLVYEPLLAFLLQESFIGASVCVENMSPLERSATQIGCFVLLLALANRIGALHVFDAGDEAIKGHRVGNDTATQDEYVDLNPAQMIARAGYPAESYIVTTDDGYLLTLDRIPPIKDGPGQKHPVFLQHGLVSSSADWLILGPRKSLAYLLADEGFDVWLGNVRGNTYSRAHLNYSTSSSKFWNFSFHEMGYYDLPAVTSFILQKSGQPQLSYVGHSMGTTMFWVFCSTRPELQHRVRQMHALAPVAYMSQMQSPLRNLAPFERELQVSLALLGEYEFLRHGALTGYLEEEFLKINHIGSKGAEYVFFYICGFDPAQFNKTLLPDILGHTPAGASTQTVLHYLQEVKSAKFRQYDEGTAAGNERKYGTPEPPEYDLSLIEVPIFMHYSLNDYLAGTEDVKEFYAKLKGGTVKLLQVPLKTFNHLDFMWANEAKKYVYDPVILALKKGTLMAKEKAEERLTKERLSQDMQNLSASATAQKEMVTQKYKEHVQPTISLLVRQLQQLNERQVSAELTYRWAPDLIGQLKKLKRRVATVERDRSSKIEALESERAGQQQEWYHSAISRVKRYPDLLVVKSAPLLDRMLSTLAHKVNETAAQAKQSPAKREEQAAKK